MSSEQAGRRIPFTVTRMDSDWILWGAVLIVWPLLGFAIAYVFSEIVRGEEASDDTTLPPKVSYQRAKRAARRALTPTRTRRFFGNRRPH